jgi:4-diphosphocytidyl-2-C-methyl-D-erythritol kinase
MSAREARVEAQAKLNLFLRVFAREASGYHQIETLFCRIALSDTVSVRIDSSGRSLECHGERYPTAGLGPVEKNLAWRAATAYASATGFPDNFHVSIDKRIPVGGGLGGGSADAGRGTPGAERAQPPACGAGRAAPTRRHVRRGRALPGAGYATLAIGRGHGERLELLPALPARAVWLLIPDKAVGTADAYRWLDEAGRSDAAPVVGDPGVPSWQAVAELATNDFEPVVGARVPIIGRLLSNLREPVMRELLGKTPSCSCPGRVHHRGGGRRAAGRRLDPVSPRSGR